MMMDQVAIGKVRQAVSVFEAWLETYGETSYDHGTFFASRLGCRLKALYYSNPLMGTLAVSPLIFCEAFVPSARALFWKRQRFPIADAHYAMGFATLAQMSGKEQYNKQAIHFLDVLEQTRCANYNDFCWGYPFDWETQNGTIKADTPLITTIPYAYEAFSQIHEFDKNPRWRAIMRSIAEHALTAYGDIETSPDAASCVYSPAPEAPTDVINASAYRSFLLTRASVDFADDRYRLAANRNLNFVLNAQCPDGSWPYANDGRDFVDHYHTCFVLKALVKIERLTGDARCAEALGRGVTYYVKSLFDDMNLPKPFAKAPRLTIYRRGLYDYAECVNLIALLKGRFPSLDVLLGPVLNDLFERWQKPDGSFRTRELLLGWDNVPMHRYAQAQMFRSLCVLLHQYHLSLT